MKKKLKAKQKKFQTNKKSFFLVTVLCMGIGFAYLTSNLTINGNTSVSGNKWNVYLTNIQVDEYSVEASVIPTTSGTTTTSLNYTVTLNDPGDYYEFTVDAVNNGTIDAMIQNIHMTSLDSDLSKYLKFTATYLDGTPLSENDILKKNRTVTYRVKVEFKTNISSATDLPEENVNLNLTFGVDYVQSPEPIPSKFVNLVKDSALSDSGINFKTDSSVSNGQGLYVMDSTVEDAYPIYYYRGAVDDNNAKFGGFCWKIVRTTDTGGTKLIYNGLPGKVYSNFEKIDEDSYLNVVNDETYPFTYDSASNEWVNTNATFTYDFENEMDESEMEREVEFTFSLEEADVYYLYYNFSRNNSHVEVSLYNADTLIQRVENSEGRIRLENVNSSSVFKVKYRKIAYDTTPNDDGFHIYFKKGAGDYVIGCPNETGESTQLSTKIEFNANNNSLAYAGYMYGTVYEGKNDKVLNDSYAYGSDFEFIDGMYRLKDMVMDKSAVNTHHYTCFNTTGTCSKLAYIYHKDSYPKAYYITLEDGKGVEDAINEMRQNLTSSTIKNVLDNWFHNTFETYFTNRHKDYNSYLEDTIWCNDRSVNKIDFIDSSWSKVRQYTNNGWIADGGNVDFDIYYGISARSNLGTPKLDCPNKNDSFTVNETLTGNGALTYPVGLLTGDEIILAGRSNEDYYLYNNTNWWTMTPYRGTIQYYIENGYFLAVGSISDSFGVRPSISIKPTVKVATGGNGTAASPYEFVVD